MLDATINNLIQSNKLATVAVGASTGSGLAQMLDLIPDDIGKLSAAIGVVLGAALLVKVVIEIIIVSRKLARGDSDYDD